MTDAQVPVPVANQVPTATSVNVPPSPSSTPSPVLIPADPTPAPMTQQEVIARTIRTFLAALIPGAITIYNAGGTPVTQHKAFVTLIFSAGAAAVTYLWNNGSVFLGKKKAESAQAEALKIQTAVNDYLATHGGKV